MILHAEGLSYAYPGTSSTLADVGFSITTGERVALLGVNGAGKSTLFQLLNGSLKPGGGTLLLDGAPVSHDRKGLMRLRASVGLVMQDPDDQLFAATVAEDVSFGPANMGLPEAEIRRRVASALAAMGISDLAETPTHRMSFGQKKRAAIAGVIAMEPRVLLLDEPTAGLDPRGVEELMATLDQLNGRGTAIVIATHDMDLAWSWAERAVVFSKGRVELQGSTETVFSNGEALRALGLRPAMVQQIGAALVAAGAIEAVPRSLQALIGRIAATA